MNGATIGTEEGHYYLDLPYHDDNVSLARPYFEIGAGAGSIIAGLEDFTITFFMFVPDTYRSDFTWEFSNSFNQATDAAGHMFFDCVHQKTTITLTNFNGEAGNKIDLNASVPTNDWFHYAFTLAGNVATYYSDAVEQDTAHFTNQPKDLGSTEYNWIGRCGYDTGGDLAGQYNVNPAKIADFRLYNRALSTEEITALSNGDGEVTSVHSQSINPVIANVYPNPFNSITTFSFNLQKTDIVNLEIYNVVGKKVATLVNGIQSPGSYNIKWNAETYDQGIYFYKIQIGDQTGTGKLLK